MKGYARLFAFVALACACAPVAHAAHDVEDDERFAGLIIANIAIIRHNVFDLDKEEENTKIGRLANEYHTVTQEKIIRQELIFKEGDRYDPAIIEESERNLRRYDFLTKIKITPVDGKEPGTVDIIVETTDQWSLIVGGTFGGTNDNTETGLDFGEKNLHGSGQTLNYRMRHDNSGFTHSYGFKDETLFDSRYALALGYKVVPDEKRYDFKLEKPFRTLETKEAHGITYLGRDHDESALAFESTRVTAFYGWGSAFTNEDVLRLYLSLSYGEQSSRRGAGARKTVRDNKITGTAEFLIDPRNYVKDTYIEKFRQVEDIYLGTTLTFELGPRPSIFGTTSGDLAAGLGARRNFMVHDRDYLFTSLDIRHKDDEFNDDYADLDLKYYYREFASQSILLHARASYLQSETNRFRLGGTNGLRGYKVDEFEGQNQLVLNIEDRIFTYRSMLSGIVEPGFVLFVDAGNTWNEYGGDKLTRLYGAYGFGLRFALLKAPGISLIRVDWGQPFDPKRAVVVTIGMEGFF